MIVKEFLESLNLSPDSGHEKRTEIQRHLQDANVPLQHVHEHLLTRLKLADVSFTGVLLQIRNYLDKDFCPTCTVFKMSSNANGWLTRERGLVSSDKIINLMQGPNPNQSRTIYHGDRNIGDKSRAIIQLHKLDLTSENEVVARDVIGIAIWIPSEFSVSWLVQEQRVQNA